MRARHVLGDRGVPIANGRKRMARDTLALVEDLDRRAGDARLDDLADQLRRHRVVVAGDLDVIVGRDAGPLPFRIAVRRVRQRIERRAVKRLQQLVAALADAAHDLGIDRRYAVTDRGVQFGQREEARLRSFASTKRWTIWTATSTFALSRGFITRAGSTTQP